jgi:transposase-like protein
MAIYIFMAHKKGISSVQLGKDIGVTQKSAWFMLHRIRYAVRTREGNPLSGTVEMDDAYIGGKQHRHGVGRGTQGKTIVVGAKQRGGDVRAQVVPNLFKGRIDRMIQANIAKGSKIYTDELAQYKYPPEGYEHDAVEHGKKEYVRGDVHTNGIESFWALLKRGIHGIYHHVSSYHLDKYCDEFEFRMNSRGITDPARLGLMLSCSEGRLTYRHLTGGSLSPIV